MKERSDSGSSNKHRSSFNGSKRSSNFHHKSYEAPENELATIEINYDVNSNEKFKLTYKNNIKKYSYDVDTLLELRRSSLVKPFDKISNDFWRLHVYKKRSNSGNHYGRGSFQKNSSLEAGESSTGEMGSFSVKTSNNYSSNRKSSGNHSRNYNRNNNNNTNNNNGTSTGFFGNLDFDDDEEGTPEWLDDSSDGNSKDNGMSAQDLGRSVGDFEKWKVKMRLKEKKKQGISLTDNEEAQLDAILNDKNYVIPTEGGFFSFGADSSTSSNALEATLEGNGEQHASSRFSSFFKSESSNDLAVSDEHASSKILAMLGKATGDQQLQNEQASKGPQFQSTEAPVASTTTSTAVNASSSSINSEIPRAANNDSFFMSLLNKKPEGSQNTTPQTTSSSQVASSSNLMNFLGNQNNVLISTPPPGLIQRSQSNIPPMQGSMQMQQQQLQSQPMQQSPQQQHGPQAQQQRPQQMQQNQPIYPPGLQAPPPGISTPNSGFPPGFPKVNHVQQLQPLPAGYPYGAQQPQQFQMPPQQLPPWLQANNTPNNGMPPPGLMLGNRGNPANSTPGSSAGNNGPHFQPPSMYQMPPYQNYAPGMGMPPNNQQMNYLYGAPTRQ